MVSTPSGRLTKAAQNRFRRLGFFGVIAAILTGCASSPPENPDNICSIFKEKRSWYRASRDAQYKWGTPKSLQLAIIRQESAFDADAKPSRRRFLFVFPGKRRSTARGFPQAIEQTWETYIRATGNRGADRDSFRDAADFVAWYARETSSRNGVARTDAYRQYLAYHEGWGGYARGSYQGKPTLQAAARRVASTASRYEAQLRGCEKVKKNGKTKFKG